MGTFGKIYSRNHFIQLALSAEGVALLQAVGVSPTAYCALISRSSISSLTALFREHALNHHAEDMKYAKEICEFASALDDFASVGPAPDPDMASTENSQQRVLDSFERTVQNKTDSIWRHIVGTPEELTIWGTPRKKTNKFIGCDFSSGSDTTSLQYMNKGTFTGTTPCVEQSAPRNLNEVTTIPYKMTPAIQKTTITR